MLRTIDPLTAKYTLLEINDVLERVEVNPPHLTHRPDTLDPVQAMQAIARIILSNVDLTA